MAAILLRDFFLGPGKFYSNVVLARTSGICCRARSWHKSLPQNRSTHLQEYLKNLSGAPQPKSVWLTCGHSRQRRTSPNHCLPLGEVPEFRAQPEKQKQTNPLAFPIS